MNRPSLATYAIGNPISYVAAVSAAAFFGYRYATAHVAGGALLVSLFLMVSAHRANGQLRAFGRWKREWDGMGPSGGFSLPNLGALRVFLGVGIWLVFAFSVFAEADNPEWQLANLCFWIATSIIAVAVLVRLVRHIARTRAPRRAGPVKICVGKPILSPTVQQAHAALPAHCLVLFR